MEREIFAADRLKVRQEAEIETLNIWLEGRAGIWRKGRTCSWS